MVVKCIGDLQTTESSAMSTHLARDFRCDCIICTYFIIACEILYKLWYHFS